MSKTAPSAAPPLPANREARWTRIAIGAFLIALFLFGLWLRVDGLGFGLPYAEESDEPLIMDLAIKMLATGDWNPHWFTYPTFYIYLESFVTWLYFLWERSAGTLETVQQIGTVLYDFRYIPQPELYVWGRALTAICGALTPIALYGAAATLYSRRVGVAAAIFLAVGFLHVQYSHYIRTDIPMTLFVTLTLWFSAQILKRGRVVSYLLAGASIGMTVGSKYNGFLVALIVITAHLFYVYQSAPVKGWRALLDGKKHLPLVYAGAASLVTFFVLNPFALLDFATFWYWSRIVADYYVYVGPQLESALRYDSYFRERGGFGDILTLLAYAGLIYALVKHRPADIVAAIFPIAYIPLVIAWQETPIRSALPWTPFLALFAALALVEGIGFLFRWLGERYKLPRAFEGAWQLGAIAVCVALLCIAPVTKIVQANAVLAQPSTRALATEWANANLRQGARVLSEERGIQTDPWYALKPKPLSGVTVEQLQAEGVNYAIAAQDPPFETLRALDPNLIEIKTFPASAPEQGPYIRIFQVPAQPLPVELVNTGWADETLAPGQTTQLRLTWRATEPLGENYDRFVRLVDAAGEIVDEKAGLPRDGTSQPSRWVVGQEIADTQTLELPEDAGRYHVEVGFYRQGTTFPMSLQTSEGEIVQALDAGTIKVAPPLPPTDSTLALQTADAVFGDRIRLRGFDVAQDGDVLRVTLDWEALEQLSTGYTRFVHLVGAQVSPLAQNDAAPVNGLYPTNLWDAGERVREVVEVPLADVPNGTYGVRVGWYEYPSLQRLLNAEGEDSVRLDEVKIGE